MARKKLERTTLFLLLKKEHWISISKWLKIDFPKTTTDKRRLLKEIEEVWFVYD